MHVQAAQTFLWFTFDGWQLIFGAINTVILVFGAVFAVRTIQQATTQRMNDSFSKMLEEWRGVDLQQGAAVVVDRFPVFEGSLDQRLHRFLEYAKDNLHAEEITSARQVVHRLNDLGSLVERGAVSETHFFSFAHPKIIELGVRLDVLVLLVSAQHKFRWGMRVRRMRAGAELFYRMSSLYNVNDLVVDGMTLLTSGKPPIAERLLILGRRMTFQSIYLRSARSSRRQDVHDLAIATVVLSRFQADDIKLLGKVLK